MARMDELYNDIYNYCEEFGCWQAWHTITEWNENFDTNYGVPSFTALVNAGKLMKEQRYGEKAYSYRIVPTDKIKEIMEAQKVARERRDAERIIADYEKQLERRKARYEERIKEAENQYKRDLEWDAEQLEKAKALLGM